MNKTVRHMPISLIIITSLWACSPEKVLLEDNKELALKYNLVRYYEKMPESATKLSKFETEYDAYYKQKAQQAELKYYQEGTLDTVYFEIHKRVPSITEKYAAVGGLCILSNDSLLYYEEVYRTYKMAKAALETMGVTMFDQMVNGRRAAHWYLNDSEFQKFCEFPNVTTYYDVKERMWQRN